MKDLRAQRSHGFVHAIFPTTILSPSPSSVMRDESNRTAIVVNGSIVRLQSKTKAYIQALESAKGTEAAKGYQAG